MGAQNRANEKEEGQQKKGERRLSKEGVEKGEGGRGEQELPLEGAAERDLPYSLLPSFDAPC